VPAEKVHIPEVIEPDEKLPRDLVALRKFAYLMDEAVPVPGTRRRVGLDAGLSLIPGIGEAIGAALSAWIVFGALRHRVPMRKVFRMIFNVVLDFVVGLVPVAGDVFDFLFEENMMNLQLLLRHRDRRRPPRTAGQMAGVGVLAVGIIIGFLLLILTAIAALVAWIIGKR